MSSAAEQKSSSLPVTAGSADTSTEQAAASTAAPAPAAVASAESSSSSQAHAHAQARQHDDDNSAQPDKAATTTAGPEAYEETHVHSVYEAIAPHFSATRYKPWPLVMTFLHSQLPGSVGLDVGCGNGKYLCVNPSVHLLGSDRSAGLAHLARSERRGEAIVADVFALPYRVAAADFAICIAVMHHMSTRQRRRQGVEALLDCVRPGGSVLVLVWALEQKSSRRGWDAGDEQDRMVPWVMQPPKGDASGERQTYQRYYHLYREGELEEDVTAIGGNVLDSGYERDNWWVICSRGGT